MIRQPVNSTNVKSVGYELSSNLLEIEFHGGRVYRYSNVPEGVYMSLMSAKSIGSFFHQHIKGNYLFVQVR